MFSVSSVLGLKLGGFLTRTCKLSFRNFLGVARSYAGGFGLFISKVFVGVGNFSPNKPKT